MAEPVPVDEFLAEVERQKDSAAPPETAVVVTKTRRVRRNFRSPLVGRPSMTTSIRRYIDTRRVRTMMGLWQQTPKVIQYMLDVALGKEPFHEGRFRAAREILLRTVPTVSSQEVKSNSVQVTSNISDDKVKAMLTQALSFQEHVTEERSIEELPQ